MRVEWGKGDFCVWSGGTIRKRNMRRTVDGEAEVDDAAEGHGGGGDALDRGIADQESRHHGAVEAAREPACGSVSERDREIRAAAGET